MRLLTDRDGKSCLLQEGGGIKLHLCYSSIVGSGRMLALSDEPNSLLFNAPSLIHHRGLFTLYKHIHRHPVKLPQQKFQKCDSIQERQVVVY